jgi:2-polyprenyl-3-methyl-5-hydroxy-6-metoxy-1,4-benzoquinol methylase
MPAYIDQQTLHRQIDTYTPADNYEKIRRLFDFEKGGWKILIVGSGYGALDERLRKFGNTVIGTDVNVSDLNRAAAERGDFIECDITQAWPEKLRGGNFDLVIMTDVPEHVYDPAFLLEEAKSVLAPNGKIIFGVPNAFDLRQRLHVLRGKGIVHWDNVRYGEPGWRYAHVRFFSYADVASVCEAAGWHVEKMQLNFMVGGVIPRRALPAFVRRALLHMWPGLFSGKFIALLTRDVKKEQELILLDRTPTGM